MNKPKTIIVSAPEGVKIREEFKEATDKNIIQIAKDLNFITNDPKRARKYLENNGFKFKEE